MRLIALGSVLLVALFTNACGAGGAASSEPEADIGVVEEALAASPAALLVVGNTTLASGDAALSNRLQTLGFTVTLRSGVAVTAADAAGRVVIVSESVTSGDVNTKLRNVAVPVVSLESGLFDDLGLVDSSANLGTQASQTSLVLLAPAGAPSGDVTVAVTSSAQTFSWAKPVAGASRLATLAGDSSRSTIFAFETGSALSGLTAPARRAGWFATAAAPTAFTANAWSLFDGLMRWAKAGLPLACSSNSDCSGAACVNGLCSTACPAGTVSCGGVCVNPSSSSSNCGACGVACASGQSCQSGVCSTSSPCPAGTMSCGGVCVNPSTSSSNCGGCGVACASGQSCQSGVCSTSGPCPAGTMSCGGVCVNPSTSSSNCGGCGVACASGQSCQSGVCSTSGPCPAGTASCGGVCVNTGTSSSNCGGCGVACASGQSCQSGVCSNSGPCPAGTMSCGGVCVNTGTSSSNCGACGVACANGKTCQSGSCR